ncbi:Sua5/YciO/YrdC/YwlC family protein, partial [Nostoc sp. CHAB 5715]|uniref:Sua5/YciO/YrdC/YwlC family protein n=1 Tax=Nostoc sp. CHAB 5715 TaxID=2780400 RepID=UPI001E4EF3E6
MTQVSLTNLIAGARAGLLVSFPTDTVPALAAIPEKAALIFAAKQRSQDKPLILMAASAEDLWLYVKGDENEYKVWQELQGFRVWSNDHNAYAATLATAYVQADRDRWQAPAERLIAELATTP